MIMKKSCDRIKDTATWKSTKSIWRLRSARSFLQTAVKEASTVGNEDVHVILEIVRLLDRVIENQIELNDSNTKVKGEGA